MTTTQTNEKWWFKRKETLENWISFQISTIEIHINVDLVCLSPMRRVPHTMRPCGAWSRIVFRAVKATRLNFVNLQYAANACFHLTDFRSIFLYSSVVSYGISIFIPNAPPTYYFARLNIRLDNNIHGQYMEYTASNSWNRVFSMSVLSFFLSFALR